MNRRDFMACLCAGCLTVSSKAFSFSLDEGVSLMNPCASPLPPHLRKHELVQAAFAGLDAAKIWDAHTHLLGTGDSGSGCWINPKMQSVLYPGQYLQRKFFLNAACVDEARQSVDADYVARLTQLVSEFPAGAKLMLFAFDHTYQQDGSRDQPQAAFHVPNRYAAAIARRQPDRFKFVASVHPYRLDAVDELDRCVADGAVAVKWLPSAMGIDPGSMACDRFYQALVRHRLPLITHAGQERAVKGAHQQHFGNPLRLRRALDHGVRVVVAHCASMGQDRDLDRGPGQKGPWVDSFELFARMMDEPRYERTLFADISAVPQTNRAAWLKAIVQRRDWHPRLVNGSDYPLPGVMPLFSVDGLVDRGWLTAGEADVIRQLRDYNPLLFDFVLKRSLRIGGARLSDCIFESRPLFERVIA